MICQQDIYRAGRLISVDISAWLIYQLDFVIVINNTLLTTSLVEMTQMLIAGERC